MINLNGNKYKVKRGYYEHDIIDNKTDAVKRNLIGEINSMIEKNKRKIVAQKMILLSINDAQRFYGVPRIELF